MRISEIERMTALQKKRDEGIELKPKEIERLAQLEKLAKEEEKKNGGQSTTEPTGGNNTHTGDPNHGGGGKESRSGEGTQRGKRNKATSPSSASSDDAIRFNTETGNDGRELIIEGGELGDSVGEHRGATSSVDASGEFIGGNDDSTEGTKIVPRKSNQVKPKDAKARKGKTPTTENDMNGVYSMLLMTGFSMIAMSTGREHWGISKEEADAIADPLNKVLDDLAPKQKKMIQKAMNPVILATTISAVVMPRIMIDIQNAKLKKGVTVNEKPTQGTFNDAISNGIE